MGRRASDLCIALNACVLAVASCYAGSALALSRPLPADGPAHLPAEAPADPARFSVPSGGPLATPATLAPFEAGPAERALRDDTPLRTPSGGALRPVGPASRDSVLPAHPVLKVTPTGAVMLDAGASVRYADAHRPGIRIELSTPEAASLALGRIDAEGARINPYAALVRVARRPNANAVVVENGRLFLRHAEPVTLAGRTPEGEVALQPSATITLALSAQDATSDAASDTRTEPALPDTLAHSAAQGLKLAAQIVSHSFADEASTQIFVSPTAAITAIAGPAPDFGGDTPQPEPKRASLRFEALPAPARHGLPDAGEIAREADADTALDDSRPTPENPSDTHRDESATLAAAADDAGLHAALPDAGSGRALLDAGAARVHAIADEIAGDAALLTLPHVEPAPRAPAAGPDALASAFEALRTIVDIFDDPREVEIRLAAPASAPPTEPLRVPPAASSSADSPGLSLGSSLATRGTLKIAAAQAAAARRVFLQVQARK